MMDDETPETFLCSPESLLQQIKIASKKRVIELTGRNTHQRFDEVCVFHIHMNFSFKGKLHRNYCSLFTAILNCGIKW
ncbi:putative glycoside hydrolase, family 14 [Helianthus annuus]|nr:putative glycoside hydrolase, family 14 [Helianthus annuus]